MNALRVVDSHTGGEPTRLVIAGVAPEVGLAKNGSITQRLECMHERHDWIRTSLCLEPRGSEHVVGAALVEPSAQDCAAGVIFFNNAGYLGMCGHGTMGLLVSLAHLGKLVPGSVRIDTAVGIIRAELHQDGHHVTLANVPSFRHAAGVPLDVPGVGRVHGDIAWGGNWFFLVSDHGLAIEHANVPKLQTLAQAIQGELCRKNITGDPALLRGEIDHVELFGPPSDPGKADSRSFVRCPGGQYDRSPCGTGTSAKLACLAAEGKWPAGKVWRQESVIGSIFEASWQPGERGQILPTLTGSAFVTAEIEVLFAPGDPLAFGLR